MMRSALDFGAPVTDPGGKRRGQQLGPAGVRAQPARDRSRPGAPGRGAPRPRTAPGPRREPVDRDRPEVVAHQVDDHDVLGVVLGGRSAAVARRCP